MDLSGLGYAFGPFFALVGGVQYTHDPHTREPAPRSHVLAARAALLRWVGGAAAAVYGYQTKRLDMDGQQLETRVLAGVMCVLTLAIVFVPHFASGAVQREVAEVRAARLRRIRARRGQKTTQQLN